MKIEAWMEPKQKVYVGLFEGTIVRVIEWHGDIEIDVEIDGVIERHKYKPEDIQPKQTKKER